MIYKILKDGAEINIIDAQESFVSSYCEKHGYTYEEVVRETPVEPEPALDQTIAPYNIVAGEYVTIGGVLYLATENIPNGEPIIVGQNAVKTTIEDQLRELKGE